MGLVLLTFFRPLLLLYVFASLCNAQSPKCSKSPHMRNPEQLSLCEKTLDRIDDNFIYSKQTAYSLVENGQGCSLSYRCNNYGNGMSGATLKAHLRSILTTCTAESQCGMIRIDEGVACAVMQCDCEDNGCYNTNNPPDPPQTKDIANLAQMCLGSLCCLNSGQDNTHKCWDTCASISDTLALSGCHLLDPDTPVKTIDPPTTQQPATPTPTPVNNALKSCRESLCCQGPLQFVDNSRLCWDNCAPLKIFLTFSFCFLVDPDAPVKTTILSTSAETSTTIAGTIPTEVSSGGTSTLVTSTSGSSPTAIITTLTSTVTTPISTFDSSTTTRDTGFITSTTQKPATTAGTTELISSTALESTPSTTTKQVIPIASVASAASLALSRVQDASSAVSAYNANPTSGPLAAAAQSAISTALSTAENSHAIAEAAAAASVAASAAALVASLESAAAAAAVAVASPAIEAATSLLGWIVGAVTAGTKAVEDSKEPEPTKATTKNTPSGSSTLTSSSSAASSSSDCPICVPWPGETSAPLHRRLDILSDSYASLAGRADDNRGNLCGFDIKVPSYSSWSDGAIAYGPSYTYQYRIKCGDLGWALVSGIPKPLPGYTKGVNEFATEHIYEIQQIKLFLVWAAQNIPQFAAYSSSSLTDENSAFCTSVIIPLLFKEGTQWTSASFYNGGATSPISDIYAGLPGSLDSTNPSSEFVYLNREVNALKGVLFGLRSPVVDKNGKSPVEGKSKNLLKLAQLGSLIEYLYDDHVVAIYRTVSDRIKARFVNFGAACQAVDPNDSRFKGFKDLEGVDWAGAYDRWEFQYLEQIEVNMRTFVADAAKEVRASVEANMKKPLLPFCEKRWYGKMLVTLEEEEALLVSLVGMVGELRRV